MLQSSVICLFVFFSAELQLQSRDVGVVWGCETYKYRDIRIQDCLYVSSLFSLFDCLKLLEEINKSCVKPYESGLNNTDIYSWYLTLKTAVDKVHLVGMEIGNWDRYELLPNIPIHSNHMPPSLSIPLTNSKMISDSFAWQNNHFKLVCLRCSKKESWQFGRNDPKCGFIFTKKNGSSADLLCLQHIVKWRWKHQQCAETSFCATWA